MASTARTLFKAGDVVGARLQLTSETRRLGEIELLARIDYLQGRYPAASVGFRQLIESRQTLPLHRYRARRQLSLALFQENRFEEAARLPLRDPMSRLMRSFRGEPNRIIWSNVSRVELPFLQQANWELPRVAVVANGEPIVAKIDTGGDLFSLPFPVAERLGIAAVATSTGWFAGSRRARIAYGILDQLDLGHATIENVPISINSFNDAVIGTGLLRQFLPTLDYKSRHLVLLPRSRRLNPAGFPFLLAGTHLLISAGMLNEHAMTFLVDSGLEVTNEAAFLAPESRLRTAGIRVPKTSRIKGNSGAGQTKLNIGEFAIHHLGLGSASREHMVGLTGIFPKQLARPGAIGFPIDGLVSHNFLRHYRWTIDFDQMGMTLASP